MHNMDTYQKIVKYILLSTERMLEINIEQTVRRNIYSNKIDLLKSKIKELMSIKKTGTTTIQTTRK